MSEPATSEILRIVRGMARALDADDFAAARAFLADDCLYEMPGERRRGADEILASYAAASAWARRTFDEVRYASEVTPPTSFTASVVFTDYLRVAGRPWHRYRCRQDFTVGPAGRIVRIVHHEVPGEREALDLWLRECGIER